MLKIILLYNYKKINSRENEHFRIDMFTLFSSGELKRYNTYFDTLTLTKGYAIAPPLVLFLSEWNFYKLTLSSFFIYVFALKKEFCTEVAHFAHFAQINFCAKTSAFLTKNYR